MKKYITLFVLFILFCFSASAQQYSGTISDTSANIPVQHAIVALLQPGDSLLVAFSRTDAKGHFQLKEVPQKEYILMVMHPRFADYVDNISGSPAPLGTLAVTPKSKLLEAVILKSGNPIRIKGDTTIYTADSFKVSANANVEELLKKLPGIQVDKNGQIKAMGQTVEKVLVDGEEFFGDDPGMAVKNLRADAVKEVQVFDKKSDQAEFTGIDDGNTKKTINLKLKEDKKKGYFGKVNVSGGLQKTIDDRYNNNFMYSSFKGKRKISGFILNGNTGQDGLDWKDNEKFGGESDNYSMSFDDESGGFSFMSRGNSTDDEPYVNTQNGFLRNLNAGLQYSNKWNNNGLNFSPKFNSQLYDNNRTNLRSTTLKDTVLNENSITRSHVNRYNFKSSAIYDMKLDSNNTLKFTLRGNYYNTINEEATYSETDVKPGTLINSRSSLLQTNYEKVSLGANVIYKHKFKKNRRTLSINADWKNLTNDGENNQRSENTIYSNNVPFTTEQDQLSYTNKSTQTFSSKIVYTEPLNKKYALELSHEIGFNGGKNNQQTYSFSPVSNKYDVLVDSLSNNFIQKISVNKPSVKLSYSHKKIKFNFGSGFGITHFNLEDVSYQKSYVRNFINFFPSGFISYNYKSNHNLRFSYSGSTTQPTFNQLQPLRNNNDFFNQYIGNPDLKPSFSHNFSFTQNGYDFLKDRWMYTSLNFRVVSNAITNNRIIDPRTGKNTTQPVNTNGNMSINLWTGTGFKVKKINTRFNINPNLNYSKFADVINNQLSFARSLNTGLSLSVQKSKDKKYDFSLGNDFSYNSNKTSQNNQRNHFNSNTIAFDGKIYIKKVWSIQSDISHFSRQKLTASDNNLSNTIWNARLERTFKKDEFTFYVLIRDILDENIGVTRNYNSNTFTEETNDRLRQYWMAGFAWNFKNKAPKAK